MYLFSDAPLPGSFILLAGVSSSNKEAEMSPVSPACLQLEGGIQCSFPGLVGGTRWGQQQVRTAGWKPVALPRMPCLPLVIYREGT